MSPDPYTVTCRDDTPGTLVAGHGKYGRPPVRGKCPSCGLRLLFLGEGGFVTCGYLPCADPEAVHRLLQRGAAS